MAKPVDSALALADSGFRVFPAYGITRGGKCQCGDPECDNPGKHPAITGWKQAATTDADQILEWWKQRPGLNPAVATGDDLAVLD